MINIFDNTLKFFAFFRAFFYLLITIESITLGYLYWNAYKKYKTTPIIDALQKLLFSIGISYFYMVLIALVSFIDRSDIFYSLLIIFIPLFSLPLFFSIRKFREESTKELQADGKKMTEHYKLDKKL